MVHLTHPILGVSPTVTDFFNRSQTGARTSAPVDIRLCNPIDDFGHPGIKFTPVKGAIPVCQSQNIALV